MKEIQNDIVNPDYQFENFFVADKNRENIEWIMNWSDPGIDSSVLLISGDTGVGKTHLFQAFANKRNRLNENSCLYITTQTLIANILSAIKSNELSILEDYLFCHEAMIIDDIHELEGKDKTLRLIFGFLKNFLKQNHRILIITSSLKTNVSNLLIEMFNKIEIRNRSMQIFPQRSHERYQYLKSLNMINNYNISNEILHCISEKKEVSDMRILKGILTTLQYQSQITSERFRAKKSLELLSRYSRQQ